MTVETELRTADPADRGAVEDLLARNDLPVSDLSENLDRLCVCETDGERVGVGGLEMHGEHALLRSVAVEADVRNNGFGRAICERLLDDASEEGVRAVYLLTTTAPGFFASLGFAEVDRESAPPAIRETTEFDELCPDTAVCMERELD